MNAACITDPMTCPVKVPMPPRTEKGCCGTNSVDVAPVDHLGGALVPAGSPNVKVNNLQAARTGDIGVCTGVSAPNLIVTGASSVKINNQLAARLSSVLVHPASKIVIDVKKRTVKYGGPAGGAVFGDMAASNAATEACKKAAREGRGGEGKEQGKDMNCGMESVRQLCLQKCTEKKLPPTDPACTCGNTSQDDWYKRYLDKYKDEHNAIAQKDYEENLKKYNDVVAENDATWKKVQEYEKFNNESHRKPGEGWSPKEKSWHFAEGQNIWVWEKNKTNNAGHYFIKRVPTKPMPPITDANAQATSGDVGSFTKTREAMLKECGYQPGQGNNSASGIGQDLAHGNEVLAVVDVGKLGGGGKGGAHTITVTRMEYDASGKLTKVIINDTSRPNGCGKELSGDEFNDSILPDAGPTNVVPAPVP